MINSIYFLAYGGFSGDVEKDMVKIYAFIFPKLIFLLIEFYLIWRLSRRSVFMSLFAILIHLISVAILLPALGVMGDYGPHHVGLEIVMT